MKKCEVCGRQADIHHIVHRSEGGLDIPLNYKYLCDVHHRGKDGPHRNEKVDIQYKLDLQNMLERLLNKEYYTTAELIEILQLNRNKFKRLIKSLHLFKEGYRKDDIIFQLLGHTRYEEFMLEEYEDFVVLNFSV